MTGLPLTTGEGNTARRWQCEGCNWWNDGADHECDGCGEPKSTALMSRSGALADLSEALAECGRLREQLDAARQALTKIANPPEVLHGYANQLVRDARAALGDVAATANQTTDSVSAPSNCEGRAGGSEA